MRSAKSHCFVETISAAIRPSAIGSWLLCWLMKEMFQQTPAGKRRKHAVKRAVETCGGKEGVSRNDVENDGERTIFAWDVGILSPRNKQSKEVSRAG